ncbi:hypothetical protein [Actinoplanes sp. HUAS TT8]|uniref:hypothetical protein n=1 Tax=Actinoplanes sp. HUAS TT8 TaxID=3447453 RepID=UPI003F51B97C
MIGQARRAVLLGLILVTAAGACTAGSPDPGPSVCPIPTAPPSGAFAPAERAPGGGGVEIVDHGFTQFSGLENGGRVSLGALVRNTSDQIAYRTQVTLRIKDAQGRDAVHPWNARDLILEIPVISPGQQVAVAARAGVRDDLDQFHAYDKVTTFDVELGSATWLPAENAAMFPSVTTTFQSLERTKSESTVRYSATTTACRATLSRGMAAVFVNASGHVVGGLFAGRGDLGQCGTAGYAGRISDIIPAPEGTDDKKTVVSEYCDVAGPEGGVYRPSGAPAN